MLFLASRSPRRRQLLDEAGLHHDVVVPEIDDAELAPPAISPACWVASLAYLKAVAGLHRLVDAGQLKPGGTVIGADTVCIGRDSQGKPTILSAPTDESHAREMLHQWQESEHEVLTGVAVLVYEPRLGHAHPFHTRTIFVDRAHVRWDRVEPPAIDRYLASGGWRGKAGAYNLAERLEDNWPITFKGDSATIMGLPMRILTPMLQRRRMHASTS